MLDSRKSNGSCSFSDEVVSYVYNELPARERKAFEFHLTHCSVCPDEVTGFISVGESVRWWRDAEFSPITPPQINIPYGGKSTVIAAPADVRQTWVQYFHRLFELSPVFLKTAAAIGCFAVILGLGWFLTTGIKSDDIAAGKKLRDTQKPADVEVMKNNDGIAQTESDTPRSDQTSVIDKDVPAKTGDPVKQHKQTANNNYERTAGRRVSKRKPAGRRIRQTAPENPLDFDEIPTLTVAIRETDEDDLRLTDLFNEIGNDK